MNEKKHFLQVPMLKVSLKNEANIKFGKKIKFKFNKEVDAKFKVLIFNSAENNQKTLFETEYEKDTKEVSIDPIQDCKMENFGRFYLAIEFFMIKTKKLTAKTRGIYLSLTYGKELLAAQ